MKNILNKGLSILLSVAMLLAMVPNFPGVMANAEITLEGELNTLGATGTAIYWDYKVGDTYQYADFTPFVNAKEGGFKLDGPYEISNAAELAGLMVIVNSNGGTFKDTNNNQITITGQQSFEGKTIKLSADEINLSAHEWVPIGKDKSRPFKANIQGQVNTATKEVTKITGMEIGTSTKYNYAGLIGYYTGSKISNIGIDEKSALDISCVTGESYIGGIVGYAYGATISNCYNEGAIIVSATSASYAGGVVGYAYAVSSNPVSISNCYNTGAIKSTDSNGKVSVGGIVGKINDEELRDDKVLQKISNCYNTGKITADSKVVDAYAGGIVGSDSYKNSALKIEISNCYNTGKISGSTSVGGIVGNFENNGYVTRTISNCYYMGATKGVGNKEDTDYGNDENGVQNLKKILAEAQSEINLDYIKGTDNTSANLGLKGDAKLGADFAMVYYFELEGKIIVPTVDTKGKLKFPEDKTGTATLKGVKITQNALTKDGYTGDTFYMYVDLDSNSTLAYKIVFNTNGGEWNDGYTVPSEYEKGKEVTLPTGENISKDGYTFADWYDNAECTGTAVTKIPTDATGTKTFYAKWKAGSYKINKSIISGGQVIATIGENTDSVLEADYNTEVTLTVKPNPGYQLTSNSLTVKYNNNKIVELTKVEENKKYTFTMPAEDVTVYAEFKANDYKITNNTPESAKADNHGYIDIKTENGDLTKVKTGETVTLTVKPDEGYHLIAERLQFSPVTQVTDENGQPVDLNKVEENKKYTFTMPAENVTVSAEFEANLYNITNKAPESAKADNHGYITIAEKAKTDEIVTLTVEPDGDYTLDTLTVTYGNNQPIETTSIGGDQYTFPMPAGEVTVSAEFELITGETKYDIKIDSEITKGKVTANPTEAKSGEPVKLTVVPDEGYKLKKDSLKYTGNSTGETFDIKDNKFTMPAENVTVYAEFEANDYKITNNTPESAKDEKHGYIDIKTENGDLTKVKTGETVTLTVESNPGYQLTSNSLTVKYNNNQTVELTPVEENKKYTFTMPANNVTVDATFEEITDETLYNVTINKMTNGTVTADAAKAKVGKTVTLTVKPDAGYKLEKESLKIIKINGGKVSFNFTSEENEYTFTMPAEDVAVSAEFEAKPYSITNDALSKYSGTNHGYITIAETAKTDETVTLTVVPNDGYDLKANSLKYTGASTQQPVKIENDQFQMPAENVTVTAEFEPKTYTITNNANQNEEGTIPCYIDIVSTANTDEIVTLTVNMNEGYQLEESSLKVTYGKNQTIALLGKGNEYTFTMPADDVTVSAEFEANPYSITNNTPLDDKDKNHGYIDIKTENGDLTKVKTDEEVTLTVNSVTGYQLTTDSLKVTYGDNQSTTLTKSSVEGEENKYTFKMPAGDVTVTAEFELVSGYCEIEIDPSNENVTVTADKMAALPGEKVIVMVKPNDGYEVNRVYVNDEEKLLDKEKTLDDYYKFSFTAPESVKAVIKVTMQELNGWVRDPIKNEETGTPWWYYYQDGEKLSGWQDVPVEDGTEQVQSYYFNPKKGNSAQTGWLRDKTGNWHYFEVNNYYDDIPLENPEEGLAMMWTGWTKDGGLEWYYLDIADGKMKTGWLQIDSPEWYYLDENNGDIKIGWQYIDGNWYFFTDDKSKNMSYYGQMQTGWLNNGGPEWYYLDEANGKMKTGWTQDGGSEWYYLDENNGTVKIGWQYIDGDWYCFTGDKSKNMRYYGQMQTGWLNNGGPEWYYLDETNGKMKTGWTQDGGSAWYYLDATDGNIKLGWQFISGKWYYFTDDKSENMRHYGQMQTGWQFIGGSWYYFYADGSMAANTLIDSYRVDENGRWVA